MKSYGEKYIDELGVDAAKRRVAYLSSRPNDLEAKKAREPEPGGPPKAPLSMPMRTPLPDHNKI